MNSVRNTILVMYNILNIFRLFVLEILVLSKDLWRERRYGRVSKDIWRVFHCSLDTVLCGFLNSSTIEAMTSVSYTFSKGAENALMV